VDALVAISSERKPTGSFGSNLRAVPAGAESGDAGCRSVYDPGVATAEPPSARERRRLAAIVAIDVVGYSRLMGTDERRTHTAVKAHIAERLQPAIAQHSGRLVKLTGDGALAEFDSAVNAVSAVIEFQQAMAEANGDQAETSRIVFRAGIHLGEVIVEDDDLYGDDVNIAVRLEGEAPPGGILVSRAVREAVSGRVNAELHALGELKLKNIVRPIRAFRVEWQAADWRTVAAGGAAPIAAPITDLGRAAALADRPSFAVLAFRNLSGDPGREYFADGLSDDIITTLSRIPNFVVIARNSSFSYKGRSVDVRQIGRELGVRYVVDGSVQLAAGKNLRISCLLIDAGSGRHLWAERYDGSLDELFELQDRITSSIVATLLPKVLRSEIARAQAKPTSSLSAYDLYLRATALMLNQFTEGSLDQALALLQQAVAIDPQFSSAWASVSAVHWIRVLNEWGGFRELQPLGLEAARRALETGHDNPLALAAGGYGIANFGGKPEEGVGHIERALALNPNLPMAWRFGGFAYAMLGQHEKSIEYFQRAMQLSPLDDDAFVSYVGISRSCFFLGRYDHAVNWSDRALRDRPRWAPALVVKVAAVAMCGHRADELPDLVQQLLSLLPRMTITGFRRRTPMYQADDREHFAEALRTAGIPD
jgi:adenylate cyclase